MVSLFCVILQVLVGEYHVLSESIKRQNETLLNYIESSRTKHYEITTVIVHDWHNVIHVTSFICVMHKRTKHVMEK